MIMIFGTLVWNNDISMCFFQFFKILIFWVVMGVKGQKTVQNDKKFCQSHFISQELYMIWFLFMVHMCKVMMSPGGFFIFLKFWFFGVRGIELQKMVQNGKNSVCHTPYLRNHTSYDCCLLYTCKMIISLSVFFICSNFDFLGC